MIAERVKIKTRWGLHMRPLTAFVNEAKHYQSDIKVEYNQKAVSGRSLIGLLQLGIRENSWIILKVDGGDEQTAAQELLKLLSKM